MFDKLFVGYLLAATGILFLLSGEKSGAQGAPSKPVTRVYEVSCFHPQGWKTYKTHEDLSLVRGFNFETIDGLRVHASVCVSEVD